MKNRKSNVNIVKTLISTLIVIVLIFATIAIGFFSTGFRNWNKEDWENVWNETIEKDPTPEQGGGSVTDENGNELDQRAVNPMPAELNFSALNLADNSLSVNIEATILPLTAINRTVDWTLSWENENSEFATQNNLSDYVTVTPSSDGSLQANVTCKKAFEETIILKCTSRSNPTIFTTAKVEYLKRIERFYAVNKYTAPSYADQVEINHVLDSNNSVFEFSMPEYARSESGNIDNYLNPFTLNNINWEFGVGTKEPENLYLTIKLDYDTSLASRFNGSGYELKSPVTVLINSKLNKGNIDVGIQPSSIITVVGDDGITYPYTMSYGSGTSAFFVMNQIIADVEHIGIMHVCITDKDSSNEDKITIFEKDFELKQVPPTVYKITTDKEEILF